MKKLFESFTDNTINITIFSENNVPSFDIEYTEENTNNYISSNLAFNHKNYYFIFNLEKSNKEHILFLKDFSSKILSLFNFEKSIIGNKKMYLYIQDKINFNSFLRNELKWSY